VLAALAVGGCGGGSDGRDPGASATAARTVTRHDEAAARVPVTFTLQSDGQLVPAKVSVPGRLPVQLTIHNRTPSRVSVTMEGVPGELAVPANGTASERMDGLAKGRYEVSVAGAGTATVVAGVAPGP
jgi:hypothetical protein